MTDLSKRDQLASFLMGAAAQPDNSHDAHVLADALIAAGWRPPVDENRIVGPALDRLRSPQEGETVQWGIRCHDGTVLPMHHDGEDRARRIAATGERPRSAVRRTVGPWVKPPRSSGEVAE